MEPGLAIPVCRRCGLVTASRAERCDWCEAPAGEVRVLSPVEGTRTWAALSVALSCRACGFRTPLDGIPTEPGVPCEKCGSFQRVDAAAWDVILPFAHDVGDLAGPHREGIHPSPAVYVGDANPHHAVGVDRALATTEAAELRAAVGPGHPVCAACHRLVEIRLDAGGVSTHCGGCHEVASYALPGAVARAHPSLRGVVARLQRADRKAAVVSRTSAGLAALVCPQCGAGVSPKDAHTVVCGYCHTVSWLPAGGGAHGVLDGKEIDEVLFWALFDGPSAARRALEVPFAGETASGKTSFWYRGLAALPGVMLAEEKKGIHLRQWALTLGCAGAALAIGYGVLVLLGWL